MPTYYLSANRNSQQVDPYLIQLRGGDILGVWSDLYPDPGVGGTYGVYGRIWRGDMGAVSPTDARINTLTEDIQHNPKGTAFANGGWAVAFESKGPSAINGTDDAWYDTYIRFYNADGTTRGPAIQITPNTQDDHYVAQMVTLSNGQALTLVARYEGAGDYDILAYRHTAAGQQVGPAVRLVDDAETFVNSITGAGYIDPSVAAQVNGTYAIAWHQETHQADGLIGYAVWTRLFRNDGVAIGPARNVAPVTYHPQETLGLDQTNGHIVARNVGGFALGWNRDQPDSLDGDVYFRLLDRFAAGQTQAVMVNSDRRAGDQYMQDIVDLGGGRTLVTYFNQIPDAIDDIFDGGQLLGRVFNAAGQAITASFMISEGAPYYEMGGGNTIINIWGQIVSTFSSEINYDDDEDVLIVQRDYVLPVQRLGAGNNSVMGSFVHDRIEGQGGNDAIWGNRGNDRLNGGLGNDTLRGGVGRDTLEGHNGNDRLFGDIGGDVLMGNGGADTLTGGQGADVFIFSRTTGADLITDFENGLDRFQIVDMSYAQVRSVIANAREVGGDTILTLGPNATIRLADTDRSEIGLSDFIF
ncbi:calcium-binding protein [Paracoccus laeviglucosivorans]|uniref:Hemolysin-type calcium-binding repeat-containing protein n=1 Tax=Paracoccus laeviglucosivorans TaxID=1197861 RepID=A0A521CAS2_9RHOB|nr:calcium-binding protein [Paracoccus laeviglucosivorans]SMO56465.1 Hemolysin-type calcium-binding repeat-containing protein [Paracoccus laeviglucosivorans]